MNSGGTNLWEHPVDTALGLLHVPIPPSPLEAADTRRALWRLRQPVIFLRRCLGGLRSPDEVQTFGLGVFREEEAEMPRLGWSSSGARAVPGTGEERKRGKVRRAGRLGFQPWVAAGRARRVLGQRVLLHPQTLSP